MFQFGSIFLDVWKICEKRRIKYLPNVVQLKEVIIDNKLMKLDKMFLWNEELFVTKYKHDLFVRNSVTFNTNSLPSSSEQPMIRHSFDAMVSRARPHAFVLEVTLFRTNKSDFYFVSNNSSFHSKHFIKFHQFIDNNNFFKLNNVW